MATAQQSNTENVRSLKRNMTLDLDAGGNRQKKLRAAAVAANGQAISSELLSSPDLKAFALASPEIEQMFKAGIQASGSSQPTPMAVYLFPKNPTERQAQFAKGFEDALIQVQQRSSHAGDGGASTVVSSIGQTGPSATQAVSSQLNPSTAASMTTTIAPTSSATGATTFTTLTNLTAANLQSLNQQMGTVSAPSQQNTSTMSSDMGSDTSDSLRDEQTVPPSIDGLPIDMRDQEKLKLERKRLRNRIAASKCRKKKLERISQLEEQVNRLKSDNQEYEKMVLVLQNEVSNLQREANIHRQQGCLIEL